MKKTERQMLVLAVSFGTSDPRAREAAIGGIEHALLQAVPDAEVRRAFTSGMVRRHIQKDEAIEIPDPLTALRQAANDGFQTVLVQPTHILKGREYEKLVGMLNEAKGLFSSILLGAPLLSAPEDADRVISAIRRITKEYDDGHTAILLAGHGTEHTENAVYQQMQCKLEECGLSHYRIGTIEAMPSLEDVCAWLEHSGMSRILLLPFMTVAGEHVREDLLGEDKSSWKNRLTDLGYQVWNLPKGLGEYEEIQSLFVRHAKQARNLLGTVGK